MTDKASKSDTLAPWWKGAVIYQIYPLSFRDTNGDGYGDLQGIIEGLDHVASLGVDGIWISPFFTSPMKDFGYDVADYCDVDPLFGSLADFDRLIAKADQLGLKVIIDQVYSHTSDAHSWFEESRQDKTNAKADWYVWVDPKPDGSPPNNWQSVFGGPAWQWDGRRQQYYLHNFLTEQPDLNLHKPEVQNALLDVSRFWLERGVTGFRLDAINFAMHDPELRDNPPSNLPMEKVTRPFDMQAHTFNQSHPGIADFLSRVRGVLDDYGATFSVAEVVGAEPKAEMKAFTAGEKHLHTAYNFDFLYAQRLSSKRIRKSFVDWMSDTDNGWPSWAFSNHDAPRAVSRWRGDFDHEQSARLYFMLLAALRGNIFMYQGEELGLPQGRVPFERLKDPEAIANWPRTLGRDGARTPMPWIKDSPNAGFSTATPWLPVDKDHPARAVDQQTGDSHAFLSFAKTVLQARKQEPAMRLGELRFLEAPDEIIAFERTFGAETMLCVHNLSGETIHWAPVDHPRAEIVLQLSGSSYSEMPVELGPQHAYWAKVIP